MLFGQMSRRNFQGNRKGVWYSHLILMARQLCYFIPIVLSSFSYTRSFPNSNGKTSTCYFAFYLFLTLFQCFCTIQMRVWVKILRENIFNVTKLYTFRGALALRRQSICAYFKNRTRISAEFSPNFKKGAHS